MYYFSKILVILWELLLFFTGNYIVFGVIKMILALDMVVMLYAQPHSELVKQYNDIAMISGPRSCF